jgi:hypothetical protein
VGKEFWMRFLVKLGPVVGAIEEFQENNTDKRLRALKRKIYFKEYSRNLVVAHKTYLSNMGLV